MLERRKFAVAGAPGRVGRHVVEVLTAAGHQVVSISRSTGVDVITGDGLEQALAGVECVVDAATGPSPDQDTATEFFTTAASNLHKAGEQAGVRRLVVVSIIGVDKFRTGYNAAKLVHERAALAGPIPVRIVRAAQFHELVAQMVDWGRRGEVSHVPRMHTQPVAARSVAETLAKLAAQPLSGAGSAPILEIAGPRPESLVDLAARLVARVGDPVRIESVSDPDNPEAVLFETGALLPGPDATLAGPTFERWLDAGA